MTVSWRVFFLLLLCVEAAVLAVLETFFLPVRFDGTLLPRLGDFPFPITIAVAVVTTPVLVQWAATLDVPPGEHTLAVRATDRSGYTQTAAIADVVPDGATGWHTIEFTAS